MQMTDKNRHDAWVLVAGTGFRSGVPQDVCFAAAAVGEAIARFDCGLVTGGWPGVDFIAAKAFAETEVKKGSRIEDRLVQVVRNDRSVEFKHGRIVRTTPGPLEWLEPQSYCDAVVLIGGVGGTYGAFLSALHKGIPRFPLGGTGGDAARAFQHMCELWDVIPNPGIPKALFETLGQSTATMDDAISLSDRLLPLVIDSFNHRNGHTPKTVFISYSRRDKAWLQRIRTALQPVERTNRIQVWTDINIEAGLQWDAELRRKMSVCDIAILLVSPDFLQSEYVTKVELPVLLERARTGRTRLLWVLLSPSPWRDTGLKHTQAAYDPHLALSDMDPANLQVALVELRRQVEAFATENRL